MRIEVCSHRAVSNSLTRSNHSQVFTFTVGMYQIKIPYSLPLANASTKFSLCGSQLLVITLSLPVWSMVTVISHKHITDLTSSFNIMISWRDGNGERILSWINLNVVTVWVFGGKIFRIIVVVFRSNLSVTGTGKDGISIDLKGLNATSFYSNLVWVY